jgi:ubiquitin-like 1-activating enzyme E1 A
MKTASVPVVNLRGLAAEVCKNIVLAGIGHLTILDPADVAEEDLGAGYFFREGEVGSKVGFKLFADGLTRRCRG